MGKSVASLELATRLARCERKHPAPFAVSLPRLAMQVTGVLCQRRFPGTGIDPETDDPSNSLR